MRKTAAARHANHEPIFRHFDSTNSEDTEVAEAPARNLGTKHARTLWRRLTYRLYNIWHNGKHDQQPKIHR